MPQNQGLPVVMFCVYLCACLCVKHTQVCFEECMYLCGEQVWVACVCKPVCILYVGVFIKVLPNFLS